MPKTHRPKLGQHFLTSEHYRRRIADALELLPDDLVIEIGPGRGAMTELLVPQVRQVVAIELDEALAAGLKTQFAGEPRLEIVRSDVLRTDLQAICDRHGSEQCRVFGNIPYYITSPIVHHLLSFSGEIRSMALLMQREVAERIVAQAGGRDYAYLTVFIQLYSDTRVELEIPPGAFSPPPKVDSALVSFDMKPAAIGLPAASRLRFVEFLKRSFSQKRKALINCLSPGEGRAPVMEALRALNFPVNVRAEELSINQFARLFSILEGHER